MALYVQDLPDDTKRLTNVILMEQQNVKKHALRVSDFGQSIGICCYLEEACMTVFTFTDCEESTWRISLFKVMVFSVTKWMNL